MTKNCKTICTTHFLCIHGNVIHYLSKTIRDYSRKIINNKLLLIVLFGKLYKLYGHGLEIMGAGKRQWQARNIYT